MKLGFSTLGCPNWKLERSVSVAKELGYDGIELRLLDDQLITPENLLANEARIIRAFRGSGVELASLGSSVRLSLGDSPERHSNIANLRAMIAAAEELGCPIIRVFGGKRADGTSMDEAIKNVADGLAEIAPIAEKHNVKVVLESHDDFSRSADVARVLAQIPSPAIGALWDTHHPYRMGESVDEVWNNIGQRLYHTHVKDAKRAGQDEWDLVLLEKGEVPVKETLALLARKGYSAYVIVEWEKKWHMEIPEPEVAFPQHIELLRGYLKSAVI